MHDEKTVKKIQKALGEPFAIEFSEYTRKIRVNLIFVSILAIVIVTQNLELATNSSFLGIRFENLDTFLVLKILFGLIIYLFIHFIWLALDNFLEWWVRLTGTRKAYSPNFDSTTKNMAKKYGDDTSDQRKSTLYYWWIEKQSMVDRSGKSVDAIAKNLEKEAEKTNSEEDKKLLTALSNVQASVAQTRNTISQIGSRINDTRITASLERFDNVFKLMLSSQSLRWLIIELSVPVFIGAYAISLLCMKI